MKKLIRTLLFGAVAAWGAKQLDRKRQEWSTRPAADIRRAVEENLPSQIDPATRMKITDAVVRAVKGNEPVVVESSPPAAQETASPPPPEPPQQPET